MHPNERVCTSTCFGVRRLSAVNYILLCWQRRLYVSLIGTGPGRKFQGAKVPPMVLSLLGAKVLSLLGAKVRSWERKYVGTKVP